MGVSDLLALPTPVLRVREFHETDPRVTGALAILAPETKEGPEALEDTEVCDRTDTRRERERERERERGAGTGS